MKSSATNTNSQDGSGYTQMHKTSSKSSEPTIHKKKMESGDKYSLKPMRTNPTIRVMGTTIKIRDVVTCVLFGFFLLISGIMMVNYFKEQRSTGAFGVFIIVMGVLSIVIAPLLFAIIYKKNSRDRPNGGLPFHTTGQVYNTTVYDPSDENLQSKYPDVTQSRQSVVEPLCIKKSYSIACQAQANEPTTKEPSETNLVDNPSITNSQSNDKNIINHEETQSTVLGTTQEIVNEDLPSLVVHKQPENFENVDTSLTPIAYVPAIDPHKSASDDDLETTPFQDVEQQLDEESSNEKNLLINQNNVSV